MPGRIGLLGIVMAGAALTLLLGAITLEAAQPQSAPFQEEVKPPKPPGGIVLVCPDKVHIYEPDIMKIVLWNHPDRKDHVLVRWLLMKLIYEEGAGADTGQPAKPPKEKVLAAGMGSQVSAEMAAAGYQSLNSFSVWDRDVKPGDQTGYVVEMTFDEPGKPGYVDRMQEGSLTIPDYCSGQVWENLTINDERNVLALAVMDGVTLQVASGARILPPPGNPLATLDCRAGAGLEIDGDLTNTAVKFDGGTGYVRGSRLQSSSILVHNTKDVPIVGNTFTGQLSEANNLNVITVADATALIEGNQGDFGVYVRQGKAALKRNTHWEGWVRLVGGGSQAGLGGNELTGGVNVETGAGAWLADGNVITGTIMADGSRTAPGLLTMVSIISNTIVCTGNGRSDTLSARNGARLLVQDSRLEAQPKLCIHRVTARDGDVGVRNSSMVGGFEAAGKGRIIVLDHTRIDGGSFSWLPGGITLGGQSSAQVVATSFVRSELRVRDDSRLIFNDNVLRTSHIELEQRGAGEFRHNTFMGADYAFRIGSASKQPELIIEQNCIETKEGVRIPGYRQQIPGPLRLMNNWWGHESGPHHFHLNPAGQGASIIDEVSDSTWAPVEFQPVVGQRPDYCRETSPVAVP